MLELLFVIGFFVMLMVTGVSLLGIIAALIVATAFMFLGGMLALLRDCADDHNLRFYP